jgi:hypothetical protein
VAELAALVAEAAGVARVQTERQILVAVVAAAVSLVLLLDLLAATVVKVWSSFGTKQNKPNWLAQPSRVEL